MQQHDEIAQYGLPIAPQNAGKNAYATPQFHVVALLVIRGKGKERQAYLTNGETDALDDSPRLRENAPCALFTSLGKGGRVFMRQRVRARSGTM